MMNGADARLAKLQGRVEDMMVSLDRILTDLQPAQVAMDRLRSFQDEHAMMLNELLNARTLTHPQGWRLMRNYDLPQLTEVLRDTDLPMLVLAIQDGGQPVIDKLISAIHKARQKPPDVVP